MFFEVHRLSIFPPRSLDVDVVLDLMIHDIDVVLTFVDSPLKDVRAVGLPVVTSKVDIAKCAWSLSPDAWRTLRPAASARSACAKLRFFQPHEYISIDYGRQDVLQITVTQQEKLSPEHLNGRSGCFCFSDSGVTLNKPKIREEEPLHAELRSFIDAVRNRTTPLVPLEDGRPGVGRSHENSHGH